MSRSTRQNGSSTKRVQNRPSNSSQEPAAHYLEWMQKGLHIITPNKKLNSGPLDQYLALRQFQRESYIHYFYEVTASEPTVC